MKTYILDTNVLLRFILNDNEKQVGHIERLFKQARLGDARVLILPETFFEAEYVLRSVYAIEKEKRVQFLEIFLYSPWIELEHGLLLQEATNYFQRCSVDFVDCYLFCYARALEDVSVFSFDRDFEKLSTMEALS